MAYRPLFKEAPVPEPELRTDPRVACDYERKIMKLKKRLEYLEDWYVSKSWLRRQMPRDLYEEMLELRAYLDGR